MIVVTGMHRSGTSLASLVLRELGANFGPNSMLYSADDWNAHGYLERTDVVDINSRAVTGFERTSQTSSQVASQIAYLARCGRGDSARINRRMATMGPQLEAIASETIDHFVKDPRFCLTLSGWQNATPIDGLVVALRHPSASVASLQRRNKLPPALGHRFWRWHMRSILPHIDERTLVLRQEDLVGDRLDESLDRARRWLDRHGIEPSGDPSRVIDRSLVHHQHDGSLPSKTEALWRELEERRSFT